MSFIKLFPWLVLFHLAVVPLAGAQDNKIQFMRKKDTTGKGRIPGLKWVVPDPNFELRSNPVRKKVEIFALVEGVYGATEGWQLVMNKTTQLLPPLPSPETPEELRGVARPFRFTVPVTRERTTILIEALGPEGQRQSEQVFVVFKGWTKFNQNLQKPRKIVVRSKRSYLSPALGFSQITYKETGFPRFTQTELTARLRYQYRSSPRWRFNLDGFSTVTPMGTDLAGTTASYRGLTLEADYFVPVSASWGMQFQAGSNYLSMTSAKDTFGYAPFLYPHVGIGLRSFFRSGDNWGGRLKLGSLGPRLSFFGSAESEVGLEAFWERRWDKTKTIFLNLNQSRMFFRPSDGVSIETTTTALSAGVTL